ncbi:MAG: phosphomannomutase/phosphoglucomutase [Pseudomonadota bacterium]
MHSHPRTKITTSTSVVPHTIFRAYDIRGIAGDSLNTTNIEIIGKALASLAREAGEHTVLFGADGRLSSPSLKAALLKGILSTGLNVIDLGTIPTPLLYFATHTSEWGSGLMLTASHNPPDYNGIKIVRQRSCLTPEQIQQIRERAESGNFFEGAGTLAQRNFKTLYIKRLQQDLRLQRKLKVVVDCANAVPGLIAPELFAALGCEVIPLYCEMDGRFPNHHPDPTVADNMHDIIHEVRAHKADLGIALDGDGDRVVLVTNAGNVIDTDRLLMLLIKDIVPRYQNPNVVFDVKCSTLLLPLIKACGGQPVMSRSGHSFMKQTMQESGAVVGAEFSAHVFIKDRWYGYDDGMYVAARFLELLSGQEQSAEDLLCALPRSIVTPELRISVSDESKFQLMERIKQLASFPHGTVNILDGIRVDFADGWGLIRASNTTPALLLRFEASSSTSLQSIQTMFQELLSQVDDVLKFDF